MRDAASFGHALVTGTETKGAPDGSSSADWDTTTLAEGWQTLTSGENAASICVRNDSSLSIEGGRLSATVVEWSSNVVHLVRNWVVVPSGCSLTITEGTVVKFCEGAGFWVESGGAVNVNGAEGTDVIFAAAGNDLYGGDTNLRTGDDMVNGYEIVRQNGAVWSDNGHLRSADAKISGYPEITLHDAIASEVLGGVRIPVTITGTRNAPFSIDWKITNTTDGKYCSARTGILTWSSTSDGMKYIVIPFDTTKPIASEQFNVEIVSSLCCNIANGVSAVSVDTYDPRLVKDEIVELNESLYGSNSVIDTIGVGETIIADGSPISISYSTKWNDAPSFAVTESNPNGDESKLADGGAPAEGTVQWHPVSGAGRYTLTHVAGDETLTAAFVVMGDETVVLGGKQFQSDETWGATNVYVISGDVTVPSGVTLSIESGTVVKFMKGASLTVASGGSCVAKGVIFTHIADDTAGGDTMFDGDATKPAMGEYEISGTVTDDDATEYRYTAPVVTSGTISSNTKWRGHKVYKVTGNLTVASGATLTIQPGAIVKFAAGVKLTVNKGGSLSAIGTRLAPIVFTSIKDDEFGGDTNEDGDKTSPAGGDWQYVEVFGRAYLECATLMYGAPSNERGIVMTGWSSYGATIGMNNCVVAHALYDGIWNSDATANVCVTNTVITDVGCGAAPYRGNSEYINCIFYEDNYGLMHWSHWTGKIRFANCIFNRMGMNWTDTGGSGQFGATPIYQNCLFYNPDEFPITSSTKVGTNGNIWGDPLFTDPDNGDYTIAANSPCVDAGDGTVAPETDYYGRPRMNVKKVKDTGVADANGICPDIGIYEVTGSTVGVLPDFALVSLSAPASVRAGEEITVTYVVTNRATAASGLVRDSFTFVAEDAALGGQRVQTGMVSQTYALAKDGVATFSATLTVPSLKAGVWRLSVTVNAERDIYEDILVNNVGKAGAVTTVALPTIGDETEQLALEAGANVYEVAALPQTGGMVVLSLPAGAAAYGANGYVPGADRSDAATVDLGNGHIALVFPARSGDSTAYLVIESSSSGAADVEVKEMELALYETSPSRLVNDGTVHLTLTGTGLEGARVALVGAATIAAPAVDVLDVTCAVATFELNKATVGSYDVQVTAGGVTKTLADVVELYKATKGAKLEAKLVLPASVRDGRVYAAYVEYANTGDEDAELPIFTVSRTSGGAQLSQTANGTYSADPISLVGLSTTAPRGVLKPGESGRVTFFVRTSGDLSLQLSQVTEKSTTVLNGFASVQTYLAGMSAAATRLCLRGAEDPGFTEILAQALNEARGAGGSAVCGTLVHAITRQPLAGYTLTLVSTNDDSVVTTAVSGDDGTFALSTTEQLACKVRVLGAQSYSDAGVFDLINSDFTQLTITATPYSTVSGIAYAAPTAALLFGAKVVLDDVATEDMDDFTVNADEDGHYSFSGLKDGNYELWAYACDGWCAVRSGVFSVTNGVSYAIDSVYTERGTKISGRVVDADTGGAITNGAVAFVPESGTDAFSSLLDSDGYYVLQALPQGNYTIKSVGGEYSVDDDTCMVDGSETQTRNVTFRRAGVFTTLQPIGMAPHKATFSMLTIAKNPRWDFDGDGQTDSTEDEPSWTYDVKGVHAVTLTYTDTNGIERVSRDLKAVEVIDPIDNTVKAGNVVLTETSAVKVVEVDGEHLVVRGADAAAWGAGTVIGMESGTSGGFIVRILSSAQSTGAGMYAFDVEPATPDDLFETYFISHEFSFGAEKVKPLLAKAAARLVAASTTESAQNDLNFNVEISKFEPVVYKFGGKIVVTTDPVQGSHICYKDSSGHKVSLYRVKKCYQFSVPMSVSCSGDIGNRFKWADSLYGPGVWGPWGLFVSVDCDYGVSAGVKATGTFSFEPELTVSTLNEFKEIDGKKTENVLDRSFGGVGFCATLSGSISADVEPYFGIGVFVSWLKVVGRVGGGVKIGVTLAAEQDVSLAYNLNMHDVESGAALDSSLKVTSSLWATLYGSAGLLRYHCENGLQKKLQISGDIPYKVSWDGEASVGKIDFDYEGDGLTLSFTEKQPEIEASGFLFGPLNGKPVGIGSEMWFFGDWSTASGRKVSHTYAKEGEYTVTHSAVCELPGSLLNLTDGFVKIKRRKIKVYEDKPPEPQEQKDRSSKSPQKSYDPNEMVGPEGSGTNRFVKAGEWLAYTIYFENKSDADVPAQSITVDAQLDASLDWSTFEVGEISFCNQSETALNGLMNGTKTVAQNNSDIKVQMSVSCDETTGHVQWQLRSYDPDRADYGYWPANDAVGILPPNDSTHCGEGHITYRVKVRENAVPSTKINASATIIFDYNDPITTDPSWWNTVAKVLTVEGSSGSSVKLAVDPAWVTKNIGPSAMDEQILAELNKTGKNGNKVWQNMALGLSSDDANERFYLDVPQNASEDSVSVKALAGTSETTAWPTIRYRLDSDTTGGGMILHGSVQEGSEFDIDIDGYEDPSGIYQVKAVFSDDNGTEFSEVPAANQIGILRKTAAHSREIVPVPWKKFSTDDDDIAVSNLVKTAGLTAGDKLYVYDDTAKRYATWELQADKTWKPVKTVKVVNGQLEVQTADSPEVATVKRGSGVWLERQDTSKPITLVGQHDAAGAETAIGAGTTDAPKWNLLASPAITNWNLNAISEGVGAKDRIIVPTGGEPRIYTRDAENTKWGYTAYEANAKGIVKPVRKEDDTTIAPGTGLWYVSEGGTPVIKW